jgi:hypothetical protein
LKLVLALVLLLTCPAVAAASQPLGDLNVSDVTLAVNAKGEALVSYVREDGKPRHVLVWGAINALPPSQDVPQVAFRFDYSGGWKKYRHVIARTFRDRCSPYDGPPLVFRVAACKAPDGSYWAIQAWYRLLPMRGFAPWLPDQGKLEFHVSHWSGPIAEFDVSQNWTYGGTLQGLFGRLTYGSMPVYGFRTPSSTRRSDGYARHVYIDAHDSAYGTGWRHDTAIVLHVGDGAFCYSFVAQVPPPGYPDREPRGPAIGDLHRVTVMGPGVTPDVGWVGPSLGAYDPDRDAEFNALFDRLVGGDDKACASER